MNQLPPSPDKGFLEFDTSPVERAKCVIALDRKNHLFVGPQVGIKAVADTLIQTAS